MAAYVDRILNGAKPAALPVETVTRYELIVNLKTAHDIGVTIPLAVLKRADQVIQQFLVMATSLLRDGLVCALVQRRFWRLGVWLVGRVLFIFPEGSMKI